jgi:hypothetical protein
LVGKRIFDQVLDYSTILDEKQINQMSKRSSNGQATTAYWTPHLTIDDRCIKDHKLFWDMLEGYVVNRGICDIERHSSQKLIGRRLRTRPKLDLKSLAELDDVIPELSSKSW